ncbi:hypothetical protein SteCoe_7966 [Stentor coeruleus]|uniref:LITAF domain-containing protein n=1 Tax=Stentor coeruleus TaxID=5963 RepID=A0A1R2CL94_9CILI|nr:hypothetical protein SteCoe_7966 [Stentor coeruleus]
MQNTKAGNKVPRNLSFNQYLVLLKKTKSEETKCPTPRPSNFSLDTIMTPNPEASQTRPFKYPGLIQSKSTPTHRRQPSVVIRNLSEIYSFTKENTSFDSIDDEEIIQTLSAPPKNSLFASTTDPRSSTGSFVKKSCSEVEEDFQENENSELNDYYNGATKPDENFTTLGMNTQEEIPETTQLGILPCRVYCPYCDLDTTTEVTIKMPTLPFWKLICCVSNFVETCSDLENWDKYQEFQHSCSKCNKVIASGYPF